MTTTLTTTQDISLLLAKNPSSLPQAINATYDGRLMVSSQGLLATPNYAYTIFYNTNGAIMNEHRTYNGVTQIKTYTYDPDTGNLTGESAWV